MRVYECVIIFDVQMADAARDTVIEETSQIITNSGGSMVEVVPFGVRKLSFEIKGRTRGDYRILRFNSGSDILSRVDRMLRLKDEVLRFMIGRYEPPKLSKKKSRKPKVVAQENIAETEGEDHGKPEQSTVDREPDPTA